MAALLACGDPEGMTDGMPPLPVQVVTAEASELSQRLPAVGSLQSPETTTVAADISGIVVFLDIPEGQPVEEGHLLARLDDAEAKASLSVARAREQNAEAELERLRPLFEEGVISQQLLDNAEAEMATADGLLEEADTRLTKTYIRAPFTGVLGLRTAQLGQYVSSGDPIVQISEVDPLELVFSLPERHASRIRTGQRALGMVGPCGERFEAEVEAIDPVVDPATRTLSLQALVANPNGSLRPGMSARVRLIIGELPDAIIVPQEAIVRQGSRYLVWILDEENRARQQEVTLGEFLVDGVHVRAGVSSGDTVVVAGHQKLRPGSPTMPVPYEPTHNPILGLGISGEDGDCLF